MALTGPSRGQPIDLSYLAAMVAEVNALSDIVSVKATNKSSLLYDNGTKTDIETANLITYSGKVSLQLNQTSKEADIVVNFPFAFKNNPIIVASIQSDTKSQQQVFHNIYNVSTSGCKVLAWMTSTSGTFTGHVSFIAIGEKP